MEENNIFRHNWDKFFKDGKTVILPIDHGTVIPVPELNDPGELIEENGQKYKFFYLFQWFNSIPGYVVFMKLEGAWNWCHSRTYRFSKKTAI